MKVKLVASLVTLTLGVPAAALSWTTWRDARAPDADAPVAEASADADAAGERAVRPVAWAPVQSADGRAVRYLSGIVRAGERAPLAFEIGGRVARVDVDVGERFAAGDTLATLDATALELELDEREAALAEAEAALADGRRDFERKRRLYRDGVEAEAPYLTAKARLATLESRAEVARTLIERARERLDDARLVAPFAGAVAKRSAEPAEFVQAGTPVLEVLGDGGGREIEVRVPDNMIDRLDVDGEHVVRLVRPAARELGARIVEIGSRAMAGASFPVTLRIDEDERAPRPGVVAEVRFALRGEAGIDGESMRVPSTAVVAGTEEASHVFVFDADSARVERRAVRLRSLEGDDAIVSGELAAGDIVVTGGASFLADGQAVVLLGEGIARFDL